MIGTDDYRYDLYYAPSYVIESLGWRRDPRDRELRAFLRTIEDHIEKFGVRYPIGVLIRTSGIEVRPGKCRVTALQNLGRYTAAAVVADFTRSGMRSPDWVRLPYDAQAIQDQFFAGSDSIVEVSRRFFSIKKRDVVNRPGSENEFARELRLSSSIGRASDS